MNATTCWIDYGLRFRLRDDAPRRGYDGSARDPLRSGGGFCPSDSEKAESRGIGVIIAGAASVAEHIIGAYSDTGKQAADFPAIRSSGMFEGQIGRENTVQGIGNTHNNGILRLSMCSPDDPLQKIAEE